MRLYSLRRNSAGWRVRIALHLKQVPFEYMPIDRLPDGAYLKLNPQGLMPALEVDGAIIPQSAAILEFLEECFPDPALLPADRKQRAAVRAFSQLIACDMHPLNNLRVRRYLAGDMGCSPTQVQGWYEHWMRQGLASLEAMLAARPAGGPFCYGDAPGLADLHLVPQLYNAARFGCPLAPYPRLLAADRACRQVPAFRAAAPQHLSDFDGREPEWV